MICFRTNKQCYLATDGAQAAEPKAEEEGQAPEPDMTTAPPPEPIRQAAPSTPPPGIILHH